MSKTIKPYHFTASDEVGLAPASGLSRQRALVIRVDRLILGLTRHWLLVFNLVIGIYAGHLARWRTGQIALPQATLVTYDKNRWPRSSLRPTYGKSQASDFVTRDLRWMRPGTWNVQASR